MESTAASTADVCPSYEHIAREYGAALGRLAGAYEANPEKRRDLLQEIHFAIWRSLQIFEGQCSIRTWVYRVAHNTAYTHIARNKRRAREQLLSLDELSEIADTHDTENTTDRLRVMQRLGKLIARLQVLDRQIILLYLEDLDATSIAAIVGLAPGNIATKIHRIKALLAAVFHANETSK
ncbi:MAG: RNA polymerase sigma factor [Proteobacteria bacterium]|nr:RNA polymerase sigma factor [Pseudomonadota bacterium]